MRELAQLAAAVPTLHSVVVPRRCVAPVCVRDEWDASLIALPRLDDSAFLLGTAEQTDLPACVDVLMDGFYKDMLTLATEEFNDEEMEALRPILAIFNGAFAKLTRAFLTREANRRLSRCLQCGGLKRGAMEDARMLVLQERASGTIVAVAELMQQPRDGKVPGDFRLPRVELPWAPQPTTVAYLSNLAVRKQWRGRGLGGTLVRACEGLAQNWGFDEVYLHAATQKSDLLSMYAAMRYEALPAFDQPWWVLALSGREPTRYHRKALPAAAASLPE